MRELILTTLWSEFGAPDSSHPGELRWNVADDITLIASNPVNDEGIDVRIQRAGRPEPQTLRVETLYRLNRLVDALRKRSCHVRATA